MSIDEQDLPPQPPRTWTRKFHNAFHGTWLGVYGQDSFVVHFLVTVAVVVAGIVLRVSFQEWCVLALCVFGVLTAEMFNSALEFMARAITRQQNPHLGGALDIGSAAVLVASIGSVIIGGAIFLNRLAILLRWW